MYAVIAYPGDPSHLGYHTMLYMGYYVSIFRGLSGYQTPKTWNLFPALLLTVTVDATFSPLCHMHDMALWNNYEHLHIYTKIRLPSIWELASSPIDELTSSPRAGHDLCVYITQIWLANTLFCLADEIKCEEFCDWLNSPEQTVAYYNWPDYCDMTISTFISSYLIIQWHCHYGSHLILAT